MACTAAQPPPEWVDTAFGCFHVTDKNGPVVFATQFYGYGLSLIGGVALLFIMYGGYVILTSQGNPVQLSKGKSYIVYSLIGLLLAIFGFVFMQIVSGNILHIPGIS